MKGLSTGRENQRADFIDSLYKSLKNKTKIAVNKHNRLSVLASTYLSDGLDPEECVELLIIEGNISRDAAGAYVNMAQSQIPDRDDRDDGNEYSFQFEDDKGRIFSSYDIGIKVFSSSESDAWEKSEEAIYSCENIDGFRLLSVSKI